MVDDEGHRAHLFARELTTQLKKYYSCFLDPDHSSFHPVYWTATWLSPFHKLMLSEEQVTVVKKYLKGIIDLSLCLLDSMKD